VTLHTELAGKDVRTELLPFSLRNPEVRLIIHNLSKNGTTEENHVLSTRRILNLELELLQTLSITLKNVIEVESAHLLLKTRGKTGVHGRTTRKDDVLVEGWAEINISILNHTEKHLVKTGLLTIDKVGSEEDFRSLETLHTDLDLTTIRKNEVLEESGGFESKTLLDIKVITDVAALLLDQTDSLEVGGTVEVITSGL